MVHNHPTFPAKAGTQIHPVSLGWFRRCAAPVARTLVGSIWAPAFAGEVGEGESVG
jgi:hypothetical protein